MQKPKESSKNVVTLMSGCFGRLSAPALLVLLVLALAWVFVLRRRSGRD